VLNLPRMDGVEPAAPNGVDCVDLLVKSL
jgi:hypothetical protein